MLSPIGMFMFWSQVSEDTLRRSFLKIRGLQNNQGLNT